jgi:cytidyltransferase-like protein
MVSYNQLFEQLLKEVDVKNIGLFPGKFKPPHIGHFNTCKRACQENDLVLILISKKEHEGITPEMSLRIWNIYAKYLNESFPFVVYPTPVLACFDIANILNNSNFIDKLGKEPKSNAKEVIDNNPILNSFINVGNNINLNLYSSPEDKERFKHLKGELYKGKGVIQINYKPVDRVTSASKVRRAIKEKKDLSKFIPKEINDQDKQEIITILNDNI